MYSGVQTNPFAFRAYLASGETLSRTQRRTRNRANLSLSRARALRGFTSTRRLKNGKRAHCPDNNAARATNNPSAP